MSGRKRVILDACVPADFRHHIRTADVVTARYVGLQDHKNGLLLAAIDGKFDVFVTVDASLVKQQNLTGRTISVIVVRAKTNRMVDLIPLAAEVMGVISAIQPGEMREVVG